MGLEGKVERRADGSAVYTTVDGDMVDRIAFMFYGEETPTAEALYAANRELGEKGMVLTYGIKIYLPAVQKERPRKKTISLWD